MTRALAFFRIGATLLALVGMVRDVDSADHPSVEGHLANADAVIAIGAGEHAPRLQSLALHGARPWKNRAEETLPDNVLVEGISRSVAWRLDRESSRFEARDVRLVYVADAPRLELVWRWQARAEHGPLEHSIVLHNSSAAPVELGLLPSFRFDWQIEPRAALERFWVEKGADTPSPEGTHLDTFAEGAVWTGFSSTYARPRPPRPREMIPYVLIEEAGGGSGWYVGIESSARTQINVQRNGTSLRGSAGLDGTEGVYRTLVPPGGTFETPTIFVGAAAGGPDAAGNSIKDWERAVLANPRVLGDPTYPLTVNNSWGSGMSVDEALAKGMIEDAKELGLEMFHLDAGWFRDVGDWQPNLKKFPHGIAAVADFAHAQGLKFGLWMDWTQAGTSTEPGALNVFDPATRDWLIADPPDGWRHSEPYKGITLDLGIPAVQAWAARELERVVSDYHLDMLEHDGYLVAQGSVRAAHASVAPDPSVRIYQDSGYWWVDSSNATDVSYQATRAYYELYRELRARHPLLLLEVCNDGGRMIDFGSAAHGDYFSITDTYDPLSNRRAFYDASYVLPPAMLESYVEKWPAPHIENFRYALRSGMLGWFSLMVDARTWSPVERSAARREIALYKSALRPLIRDAALYHVAARPDGVRWDGIEYYSAPRRRGVLYAFRGTVPDERTHRFRLKGLDPDSHYQLQFQDRGATADQQLTGRFLMQTGVAVILPLPQSSELIFIEKIS